MGIFDSQNVEKMVKKGNITGLIKALKNKNHEVRREAIRALGKSKEISAVEPLCENLREDSYGLRTAAAISLGQIGGVRAVEALIGALSDIGFTYRDSDAVRDAAEFALIEIGAPAIKPLISALDGATPGLRRIKNALQQIGTPAIEPLINALKDSNENIRRNVIDVLGQIGDACAVEPLIDTLNDSSEKVRINAVHALGQIGDARAVEQIIASLEFEKGTAKEACVTALGILGGEQAVRTLGNLIRTGKWGQKAIVALQNASGGPCKSGQHEWYHCVCVRCGTSKGDDHVITRYPGYPSCRCDICRLYAHDWDGCVCRRCPKERHTWQNYYTFGFYAGRKCTTCGEDEPCDLND